MKLLITVQNNPCKLVSVKMKSSCLKCRKNTENINSRVWKTSNAGTMVLSKCVICDSKKSRFVKNQEVKGLLSNLGIRIPILFWMCMLNCINEWNS